MAFNVRVFGFRGIAQLRTDIPIQFAGDSVQVLVEPYEWAQLLVAGDSAVESAPVRPDKSTLIRVEVPDGEAVRYEINWPGRAVDAGDSSPILQGKELFPWGLGWTISIIDALADAGAILIPSILLSGDHSEPEDAAVDTVIGNLSVENGSGAYTFTKTGDPDNKFTVDNGEAEWDAAASDDDIVRSNGNLTATDSGPNNYHTAIANASRATSKHFFSLTINVDSVPGVELLGVGLATADEVVENDYIGNAGNESVGWYDDGYVYVDDNALGPIAAYAAGDVCDVAVDLDAGLFWGRVNGGNWNDSAPANPATGVGGLDISALNLPLFPAISFARAGDAVTANFGASAYTYPAPAGFGSFIGEPALKLAAPLDYETATSHDVTIEADNGVDAPISEVFTIQVSDVVEGGPDQWLLTGGIWNDAGEWQDDDVWQDA